MFVNDTSHLPDSGRVCVAGFQPADRTGERSFFSLRIEAARAEIETMGEPRNPAHVLGIGAFVESLKGRVFAAYFAGARGRYDVRPDYRSGMYVLVDGAVYAVKAEQIATTVRRRFATRQFTLSRGDRPQRTVEYPWPWYREPFKSASLANSGDFLSELAAMVREFG